ncbi:MAG: mannosyl-oligosaccharide alpha-1 [Lasallia pustulata]|uniref:alpha-1,2-Mannosidase n=1 Tax=Lasallia pustulata TaxID=136370 RepID=A0A5M8PR66_9LECA|nr:MAG: mannosyl-oligosaccharide alpha-1 [Lasallia pustulata]
MPFPRRLPTLLIISFAAALTLYYITGLSDVHAPGNRGASRLDTAVFDWRKYKQRYPVSSITPLPTGLSATIPKIQFAFGPETQSAKLRRLDRLDAVKESFLHSWGSYNDRAYMKDELAPVTGQYVQSFGGWAATYVDTLDTLLVMGLEQDFEAALKDLNEIDFTTSTLNIINVFESTIRFLGGLLGAYDLSNGNYPPLLEKATELGEMLYCAFDTPNRMPATRWEWRAAAMGASQTAGEISLVAEIGSLTLEFTRLSQLTGDPKFYDAVQRISDVFESAQHATKIPGLWPMVTDAKSMTFDYTGFTLGGMADSLYEYLPKQYMILGGLEQQSRKLYEGAIDAAKEHLFYRPMAPKDPDVLLSGYAESNKEATTVTLDPEGQHLTCFVGGMVGIGAKIFERPQDLEVARKLVDGCIWAYDSMVTGIMPEKFHTALCEDAANCTWDVQKWHAGIASRLKDTNETTSMTTEERIQYSIKHNRLLPGFTDIDDRRYLLRPEAIESIFTLYRITGDPALQDVAWRMFTNLEKYTKTDLASSAINDVTVEAPWKDNRMESFWLAETLKYFYLIFSEPDVVSLDEYVL